MTKLVVFDWNGTLLADSHIVYQANSEACRYFGKDGISFAAYRDIYTIPIVDIYVARGFTRPEFMEHAAQIAKIFHERYEADAERAHTRKGARKLLSHLAQRGIASLLLSNHTATGIQRQLQRLSIASLFTAVLAAQERDEAGKMPTKGAKLAAYLLDHGISPHDTFIVGDTIEEVEIGKALGIPTIAISGGQHSVRRLRSAHPDFLVSSLTEVVTIVG